MRSRVAAPLDVTHWATVSLSGALLQKLAGPSPLPGA